MMKSGYSQPCAQYGLRALTLCGCLASASPAWATPTLTTEWMFRGQVGEATHPQGADILYLHNALYVAAPSGGPDGNFGSIRRLGYKGATAVGPYKETLVWPGHAAPSLNTPIDMTYVLNGQNAIFFTSGYGGPNNLGAIEQTNLLPHGFVTHYSIHQFGTMGDDAYPYGAMALGPSIIGSGAGAANQFSWIGIVGNGPTAHYCGEIYSLYSGPTFDLTKASNWSTSVLHRFTSADANPADGCGPTGVVTSKSGVVFGTTAIGGANRNGTVFMMTPPATVGGTWAFQVIYSFDGSFDGANPTSGMIVGKDGNLYGTTPIGGTYGNGTVFELKKPTAKHPNWTEITLHNFSGDALGDADGIMPQTGVVQDAAGVLYGVTDLGGAPIQLPSQPSSGEGTIFSLTPPATAGAKWTESVLWRFAGTDGALPQTRPLLFNGVGGTVLMGVTSFGSLNNAGTAYRFTP